MSAINNVQLLSSLSKDLAVMATKKTIRKTSSTRKLVGAVVLTASFSLFAIPDALAESGGQCASIAGAMIGSDDFSSTSNGGCSILEDFGKSDGGSFNQSGY